MRRRRRKISGGTIVMLLFTAGVLLSAFSVMYDIRREEGDLAMDAGMILASVNELMEMSNLHLDLDAVNTVLPIVTAVPGAVQAAVPPSPQPTAHVPQIQVTTVIAATPVPAAARTITLTFGGSVAFESSVIDGAYDKTSQSHRYQELLSGISAAVHADLNMAVLESVFTSKESAQNDMVAPAGSVEAVAAGGFDGVALGTENALAGGQSAVNETLSLLQSRGLITTGLYTPESPQRMSIMQINGMRVALLSYTDTLSQMSKRGVREAELQSAMVNLFEQTQATADIATARSQGAQAVIVFLHWGNKAATEPSQAQKRIAQALCDAGADVIIGTRSRAVLPVDMLISSDGMRQTLVAWSLGTLLSEDRDAREVVSGVLLHVPLTYDAASGKINIGRVEYTPTYSWRQEENGVQRYRVVLSNQPAPQNMIQRQQEIMGRALTLIQNVMSKGVAVQR